MTDDGLPTPRHLLALLAAHVLILAVAIWYQFTNPLALLLVGMCSAVAFLAGARLERHRNDLQRRIEELDAQLVEDDDGPG
jgi:hypothetical protein